MAIPLTDSIFAVLPETAGQLANRLGEPASAVVLGMKTCAEAIVAAMAARSRDSAFMKQVVNLATCSAGPVSLEGHPDRGVGLARKLAGENLLRAVFGPDYSTPETEIANASGLERTSVGPVLRATAPVVLQVIEQRLQAGGIDSRTLASLLSSTGNGVQRAAMEPSRTRWAIAAAVVCFLGFLWLSGRAMQSVKGASADPAPLPGNAAATITRRLPNGLMIAIPRGGAESRLLSFIDDKTATTLNIALDRVEFDPGTATLQSVSEDQLQDMAAILNAYPSFYVQIGADNSRSTERDAALASNRARVVLHELIDLGVFTSRMTSEAEHPLAGNSTEGGPAQSRRITLRVSAK